MRENNQSAVGCRQRSSKPQDQELFSTLTCHHINIRIAVSLRHFSYYQTRFMRLHSESCTALSLPLSLSLSLSLDVASVSTKQSFLVGITEQTATPHYVEMTRVVCSYLLKVAQAYSTARVTVKHDGQALRAFVAHSLRRVTPLFPSSGTNLA